MGCGASATTAEPPEPFRFQQVVEKGLVGATIAIPVLRTMVEAIGPSLPFPGDKAAILLCGVLSVMDKATTNKDNLEKLAVKACDLLQIVNCGKPDLLESNQSYKRVIDRYRDLLESCQMFEAELMALGDAVTLVIVSDTQAQVKELVQRLKQPADYQEPYEHVQSLIQQKGGLPAVLADQAALQEVVAALNPGIQLQVALVQLQMKLLMDEREASGCHRNIPEPHLRLLWRKYFQNSWEVPWAQWWSEFPHSLQDFCLPSEYIRKLEQLLQSESAKTTFQTVLEMRNPETISIDELKKAFGDCDDLLTAVERMFAGHDKADGGKRQGLCELPPVEHQLYGRDAEVRVIIKEIQQPRCRAILLKGAGGMGKTSLALAVGHKLWQTGTQAFMVDLTGASTLQAIVNRFATGCHADKVDDVESLLQVLRTARGRWLLLVDNAEDAVEVQENGRPYLHTLLTQVLATSTHTVLLITSRKDVTLDGTDVVLHEVGKLPDEGACRLVASIVPDLSEEEMGEVMGACQGIALLLQLVAGAMLSGNMDMQDLLDFAMSQESNPLVTFALHTLPASQQTALAQLSVFDSAFDERGAAAVLAVDPSSARATLRILRHRGLLLSALPAGSFTLHPDVRGRAATMLTSKGPAIARLAQYVVDDMDCLLSLYEEHPREALQGGRERRADLVAVLEYVGSLAGADKASVELCHMLLNSGVGSMVQHLKMEHLACWEAACRALLHAALDDEGCDKSSRDKALWALEGCLSSQGKRSDDDDLVQQAKKQAEDAELKVLRTMQQTLEAELRVMPPKHPNTLHTMHKLADCLFSQRKRADAEVMYRKALEVELELLGPNNPDTCRTMCKLARCLKSADAEALYRRALELQLELLGAGHPDTLDTMDKIAWILRSNWRHTESVAMYRQALEARVKVLGPDHPKTLSTLKCIAFVTQYNGICNSADLEAVLRQILEVQLHVLGPTHPDTLSTINRAVRALMQQGKLAAAEAMYQQALNTLRKELGPVHRLTLEMMQSWAACLQSVGKQAEAEAIYRQALDIMLEKLGPTDYATVMATHSLERCLQSQGKHADDEAMLRNFLQAQREVLGPEHPEISSTMCRIGSCLGDEGKHADAETMFRQALKAQLNELGPQSSDTLKTMVQVATCLQHQGKHAEAEAMYRQWLESEIGRPSLLTSETLHNLAVCLQAQGKNAEAEAAKAEAEAVVAAFGTY